MPISIDFEAIVAQFRPQFKLRTKSISQSIVIIGKSITSRLNYARQLEVQSDSYPTFRFKYASLTANVNRLQRNSLFQAPQTTVGGVLMSSGQRFWNGIQFVWTAVRQELILPGILNAVMQTLRIITDSMERYSTARPQMFALDDDRNFTDLFGQFALFFRTFVTDRNRILNFLDNATIFRDRMINTFTDIENADETEREQSSTGNQFVQIFEIVTRGIAGAILLLPVVPLIIINILRAVNITFRVKVLDMAQSIERTVFGLRADVIKMFYVDLRLIGRNVYNILNVTHFIIFLNLSYFTNILTEVIGKTLFTIQIYLVRVTLFMKVVVDLVESFRATLESILNFDLMPIILGILQIPPEILRLLPGGVPTFTLDDLIDSLIAGTLIAGGSLLYSFLLAVEGAILTNPVLRIADSLIGTNLLGRVRAAQSVLENLASSVISTTLPAETRRFQWHGNDFPDIYQIFMGGHSATKFRQTISRLGQSTINATTVVLESGVNLLAESARTFSGEADRAANMGTLSEYQAIERNSNRIARSVFSTQANELRDRIAANDDTFSTRFEQIISRGGFYLIGSVIPGYIRQLSQYWRSVNGNDEAGEEASLPTSPHILSRRQHLGRVRLPMMTIRLPGRELNDELTEFTAVKFKIAIEQAYVSGLNQLAQTG